MLKHQRDKKQQTESVTIKSNKERKHGLLSKKCKKISAIFHKNSEKSQNS